jgi:hypothetical protein
MRETGIFTGTTSSLCLSLRQLPDRYAIRAGRNFMYFHSFLWHRLYVHLIEASRESHFRCTFVYPMDSSPSLTGQFLQDPRDSRCRPSFTSSQILANLAKSAFFDDINGYALKCGSTFATKSLTFRISNLSVLSDLSGRMNPHPHLS